MMMVLKERIQLLTKQIIWSKSRQSMRMSLKMKPRFNHLTKEKQQNITIRMRMKQICDLYKDGPRINYQ